MTTAFWQGRRVFITGHTGFKDDLLTFLIEQKRAGRTVAGHGAAAKSNIRKKAYVDVRSAG